MLSRVPVERALFWVARLLSMDANAGSDLTQLQNELVHLWFPLPSPGHHRARELVTSGRRRLVAPQILLYLARLALGHCSTVAASDMENPRDVQRYERLMVEAMLIVADHSGAMSRVGKQSAPTAGGQRVTGFDLELTANLHANHRPFAVSLFDRSERRWVEIPAEEALQYPAAVDLPAEFEAATGVRFGDLRMVGLALWGRTIDPNAVRFGAEHFNELGIGRSRIDAVLRLISGTIGEYRDAAAGVDPSAEYDASMFGRRPLIKCNDGGYIVISPTLLLERTLGWLPRWDLEHLGGSRAKRAVGYLRHCTERHAVETLRAVATAALPVSTLYDESDIQAAYGTSEKNADCILVWPTGGVVVAEISTRVITQGTVHGSSPADLATDLERGVMRKAKQIDATVKAVRADQRRLTGAMPSPDRVFWPVLVTTEGFPVTPLVSDRIQAMLAAAGLLQGTDVAALTVVDIEGLEATEAVAEQTGLSLPALIDRHRTSDMRYYGYRDWLTYRHGPIRPSARIMTRWDRVFTPILEAVEAASGQSR